MKKEYTNQVFFNESEHLRGYFTVAPQEADIHPHPFWEISYVYEGCGFFYSQNETLPVKEGSVLFTAPKTPHYFLSQPQEEGSPLRLCSIIFTKDYYQFLAPHYEKIAEIKGYSLFTKIQKETPFSILLNDDNAQNIRHLMWLITHEYNHYTTGSIEITHASMLSLFIIVTRQYEYQLGKSLPMVTKNYILDELLKYIGTNYGSKLSLDLLASHTHLSREYLCRYFKKQTGKNISDYILEVRIKKAKEMLRSTTHSITEIGIYCGFPSVSSFQKGFKKSECITPSEYRNFINKSTDINNND